MTWRWPWVSRALYDAVVAENVRLAAEHTQCHDWNRELVRERTQDKAAERSLVERVLQMRREGFQPPAEPVPDSPPAPVLPVEVEDAIAEVAVNEPMARQLRATALRLLRQEDGEAAKVATIIRAGEDLEVAEEFVG